MVGAGGVVDWGWWCGRLVLVENEISEGDLVNYIFLIVVSNNGTLVNR